MITTVEGDKGFLLTYLHITSNVECDSCGGMNDVEYGEVETKSRNPRQKYNE